MTDTTQLKALRDAALNASQYEHLTVTVSRAISSLEAAEQPKPCATITLPESANELPRCSCGFTGWPTPSCSGCGKPLSAEAHQPPAEQAQQPAQADVPPMPSGRNSQLVNPPRRVCDETHVRDLHAACVRIAAERDEAHRELKATKAENTRILRVVAEHERSVCDERARADKAEAELTVLKGER